MTDIPNGRKQTAVEVISEVAKWFRPRAVKGDAGVQYVLVGMYNRP